MSPLFLREGTWQYPFQGPPARLAWRRALPCGHPLLHDHGPGPHRHPDDSDLNPERPTRLGLHRGDHGGRLHPPHRGRGQHLDPVGQPAAGLAHELSELVVINDVVASQGVPAFDLRPAHLGHQIGDPPLPAGKREQQRKPCSVANPPKQLRRQRNLDVVHDSYRHWAMRWGVPRSCQVTSSSVCIPAA